VPGAALSGVVGGWLIRLITLSIIVLHAPNFVGKGFLLNVKIWKKTQLVTHHLFSSFFFSSSIDPSQLQVSLEQTQGPPATPRKYFFFCYLMIDLR